MNIKNHQAGDKQQWFLSANGIYTRIHGCSLIHSCIRRPVMAAQALTPQEPRWCPFTSEWGIPQILRSCSGLLVQFPSSSNHLLILQILAEVTAPGSLPCTLWLEVPLVTKQCIVLCSLIFNTYHNLYVCLFMVNCNYLFHFFFLPLFTVSSQKAGAKSNPLPNVSSMPGYLLREWTPKR